MKCILMKCCTWFDNSPYSDTPKASDKVHRLRQYAFVRRGDATPYEAFGGLL